MKRFLTRASVAGLSAALVAGVALVAAPAASAAQIGTLTFNGLTSQTVAFSMTTSGVCPTSPTLATNFQIRISNDTSVAGNTAPTVSANITGNTAGSTIAGGINTLPFTANASSTLAQFASNNGLGTALPAGTYKTELICRTVAASASLGEFTGIITVNAAGVPVGTPLLQNVATTTAVAVSPTSIDTLGSSTFTATVTPASGTAVAGAIQFKVDGVNFGASVPVNAAGVAVSGAYSSSVVGSKAVTAVFTGAADANNQYGNSTSNTATLAVTQATASTTTGIALSPTSVAYPATSIATASVTRGAGVPVVGGTVQFQIDGANFGSPVTVNASGQAASAAIARTAGTYAVTAIFSGTTVAGVQYTGSTSPAATLTVTAPAFAPDVQNIQTTIPPGTLVISTPYSCATLACDTAGDNPLNLGNMVLNSTATEYKSTGTFTGIQVTDTRPGNLPWTVSALSSNLYKVGVAGPNNNETINAQNVGLTALALTSTNATPNTFSLDGAPAGANLQAFSNAAAAHVDGGASGSAGLGGSPKVVLKANSGLGTTVTSGTLTITAPTNTLDGTYTGTVTFTIIGS